jgi:hypothetical protein
LHKTFPVTTLTRWLKVFETFALRPFGVDNSI